MSPNVVMAEHIASEVYQLMDGKSHVLEYSVEDPKNVARKVRLLVKQYSQRVVVREIPEYKSNLLVTIKPKNTIQLYEDLLRRCMLETDNTHLYQEIYDTLYPNQI